jgi:hypothetical protein
MSGIKPAQVGRDHLTSFPFPSQSDEAIVLLPEQ